MIELQANERHIRAPGGLRTLCGLPILFDEWTFVNAQHARIAAGGEGERARLPCPRCLEAVSAPGAGGAATR